MGSQPHPFAVDGAALADITDIIWKVYLEDVPFSFAVGSIGHKLVCSLLHCKHYTHYNLQVMQRISDGWRNPIGSAAIAVVTAMLEDQFPDSDEDRQDFACHLLDKKRFLFRKSKGDDRKVCLSHLFDHNILKLTQHDRNGGGSFKELLLFRLLLPTSAP